MGRHTATYRCAGARCKCRVELINTRAAEKLHLSQLALSHALKRLREALTSEYLRVSE
ncbi:helix-turn-helix domain-containing protein [Halomonas sp. AOP27-A1-41]|uniref:helix-turn-helix domain-containing protein n=1 Tax=Halomonas sp. AOP27-A1-41 TaxID=3457707 RepID=UPI0040340BEA